MYQKLTLTLPVNTLTLLKERVPYGKRSEFITLAIEDKLLENIVKKNVKKIDPLEDIVKFSKKLPRKKNINIINSIKKGRK